MIERAIFVLGGDDSARRFLGALPELRELQLSDLTVLHVLPHRSGPADRMPDLAQWIRHFESLVPNVELRIKRGDPAPWIYELARLRSAQLVVLADDSTGSWHEHFGRVSSRLRALGIPILLLPEATRMGPLFERVVLAITAPASPEPIASRMRQALNVGTLEVIQISPGPIALLLDRATAEGATLLALVAEGETAGVSGEGAVAGRIIHEARIPMLIWPASPDAI